MEKVKKGRPRKEPSPYRRNWDLTQLDIENIHFVQPRVEAVSELETVRTCVKRTRQCIEIAASTGLYTKNGEDFVPLRFLP